MKTLLTLLLILGIGCCAAFAQGERGPDPNGANTGGAADIAVATPGQPTGEELLNAIGHNKVAINMMWVLITGFIVMFMQTGFAMVETGLTQAKNAAHTFAMNFMIYPLGMLGFYVLGFGIMFGGLGAIGTMGGYAGLNKEISISLFGKDFGIMGGTGFFLTGGAYDVAVFALFLFQMVFMVLTLDRRFRSKKKRPELRIRIRATGRRRQTTTESETKKAFDPNGSKTSSSTATQPCADAIF